MNFFTPGQTLSRLVGVFRVAKEQATANSLNNYLMASRDDIDLELGDIDRLFRVNRLMNAHNNLSENDLKTTSMTDTI